MFQNLRKHLKTLWKILHKQAAEKALIEGKSLNQYIEDAIELKIKCG